MMAEPQVFDAWSGPVAGGGGLAPGVFADGGLAELAAGLLAPQPESDLDAAAATTAAPRGPTAAAPVVGGDGLVLSLGDVIGDGNGEAVFLDEAGLGRLTLETDAAVVARGTAAADHAAVDGQDVGGFAYVSFDSGLTLYYPEGLDLALAPPAAG